MTDMEKVIQGIERCLVCDMSIVASDEAQKAYRECEYTVGLYCDQKRLMRDALELLKEQEAKRGHWIDSAGDDKCSVCGATYSDLYPDYQNTHYCPNCGAKMESR